MLRLLAAAAALLVVPSVANAQFLDNPRFYVGAGVGYSMIDTEIENEGNGADLDENDIGYKLFVGSELNRYFGVEAFYVNLGEASLTGRTGSTFRYQGTDYVFTTNGELSVSTWSVGAAATAGFPVHELFKPYVKLGFHRWDYEAEARSAGGVTSTSDDGFDPVFGVGFQSNITNNISIRAEAERYVVDDSDVDMISASLLFRF